mmetsp:Transcript_42421/g.57949  ORF Transcript_42421/g.57949 Transcript_42421/m.57949 type:complete len:307 (-) Transcript_42421:213-1133(-)|eukprot:CAMPEP_0185746268 /NCGR_PEP_ID=MMETSP1174-20130828/4771_1 /TAXON_ID=35687 /ORGANISM="Dictyocha speculum, Strain CCMP1381" /LENGTH=306 /DNA_ID=CAMNT_0028420817 /DNA_START=50 /DNA_END=970 /DNA_ORIENTATION=+
MSGQAKFGNSSPLAPHTLAKNPSPKYSTPPPGAYNVVPDDKFRFTSAPVSSFGGNLSKVNRETTGLIREALRKKNDPGPDQYSVAAGQARLESSSKSQHAPSFSFGSSTRQHKSRLYISRLDTGKVDANRDGAGRNVPGPGAYDGSVTKTKHSAPKHSFGLRLDNAPEERPSTTKAVGPGSYRVGSSLGSQPSSRRPSSSCYSMGSASREKVGGVLSPDFKPTSKSITPSPDRYGVTSSLGKQTKSTTCSTPNYSFGTGKKSTFGKNVKVPGPGEYEWGSTMGIQPTSKFRTTASCKFGTSQRITA